MIAMLPLIVVFTVTSLKEGQGDRLFYVAVALLSVAMLVVYYVLSNMK